ncbi:MAG: AIPR family protein, partial [Bacteroidales bacterium]|nr:AIPR family protein [Bacteroidales bacterium]
RYFFDSNIRDYQGKVEVNTEIKATLQSTESVEDFWWLNNGVTITATNASVSSKILQIEDPQIVNGLQTSFEIYNFFKEFPDSSDERNILIRVVKTDDEKSRLKVIKATNSQTNVPPSSLRATDLIHRDIEDYLLSKGFYYDRRKNYHKNQGRPINKIISISYLAQIVMAVIERKPDYARARPSTLIKNNQDYQKIFGGNLPIDLYFKLIVIQKFIEQCLRTYSEPKLSRAQIGDIKFHITMYLVCRLTNKLNPEDEAIANINTEDLDSDLTKEAIQNTFIIYDSMGGNNSVAKGKEFVTEVLNQIEEDLNEA